MNVREGKSSQRSCLFLACLWIGTLCVIYTSSYIEVSKRNQRMLDQYVTQYSLKPLMMDDGMKPKQDRKDHRWEDDRAYQLSTFHSVVISYDNEVLMIHNNETAEYDEDELIELAFDLLQSHHTTGTKNHLIYRMVDKEGYTLIAFMDNTIMQQSMITLFRYTLIFGGCALIALFFLAAYLAKRIVRPLEESYKKQKQFISDAGHELKTPVSVIGANADLLNREIGENQWLANIRYENERMGILVTQLLELARTEQVTPQMERLDFSHLIYGETLPFESVAYEKGCVLNCNLTNDIFIVGNSNQLKQLVSILLDNAIANSTSGKEVSLILSKEKNHAKLSVINEGQEIPVQQRK